MARIPVLRVITPGPLTTVQDLGRAGCERFGVPRAGAMDWFALRAVNRLVGNPPNAAGLEFTVEAPVLQAMTDLVVAAAGRGFSLSVQGRRVGLWRAALVRRGEVIHFTASGAPGWCCLAAGGGIDLPPVMGSRATYLRGGFGGVEGRALQAEDMLPLGAAAADWLSLAGRWLPPEKRPAYDNLHIPVILGPQEDYFSPDALQSFLSSEYTVSPNSDRMGYRLQGAPIPHQTGVELLSEGIAPGSVQIPPDGQPIVMLSDRPATGGYPKIAAVTQAGLPRLVQAMPGTGRVRFSAVSLSQARADYRRLIDWIENGVEDDED
jgi:biotin-dependent carboxylase-like uncharacterized protein